jgi:hypothetical protein
MAMNEKTGSVTDRREFLKRFSRTMAASVAAWAPNALGENASVSLALPLPTLRLGKHRITRLVVGSNPISGYSYLGPIMDQHMREYFTPERITGFLWQCEQEGITVHQCSKVEPMEPIVRSLRARGSRMQFICLHAGGPERLAPKEVVKRIHPIAIVHHGGVTDRLFREGKSDQVRDFVKRVRDAGVLAGVSAHNPDCIKRIADEDWPVDLFMTCFYYLTRTPEEKKEMPPIVTEQIGYPFYCSDPVTMTEVVRQVKQPCLGFKILAGGRKCTKSKTVEAAFQFAFDHIKPSDGVIVGLYPRFQDQISDNARYTRQYG